MYPRAMEDSDCVMVMGSNMAENHPVAFRWPMKAKVEHGAKLIHVDPRFTRTSAMADVYAPLRAGSDIAFLGGLVRFVLDSERWNQDPFFRTFVTTYTNAATIVSPDFRDTEQDMGGVFSGLMAYKGRSTASSASTTPSRGRTPARTASRPAPRPTWNRPSSRRRAAAGRTKAHGAR
jgi:formate dehydrogenase major subunit